MTARRWVSLVVAALLLGLIGGCSPDPSTTEMPVVNDQNCDVQNIKKIEDKAMRQRFAGQCARRGGFAPSTQRKW